MEGWLLFCICESKEIMLHNTCLGHNLRCENALILFQDRYINAGSCVLNTSCYSIISIKYKDRDEISCLIYWFVIKVIDSVLDLIKNLACFEITSNYFFEFRYNISSNLF